MTDDKQTERETLMAARLDAARARHAEPVPAAIAVGQWRVNFVTGEPYRVATFNAGGAAERAMSRDRLASPREVLDAKLATLTPEQRARVRIETSGENDTFVNIDRTTLGEIENADAWWDGAGELGIDDMLAAIDRALAVPPKKSTTPEGDAPSQPQQRWYVYDPEIGIEFYTSEAEAKQAADEALDHHRDDAGEGWHESITDLEWGLVVPIQDARIVNVRPSTVPDFDKMYDVEFGDSRPSDQFTSLRSQLAAMTAERDALEDKAGHRVHNALEDQLRRFVSALCRGGRLHSREASIDNVLKDVEAGARLLSNRDAVIAERDAANALNATLREDNARWVARVKDVEARLDAVRELATRPAKGAE